MTIDGCILTLFVIWAGFSGCGLVAWFVEVTAKLVIRGVGYLIHKMSKRFDKQIDAKSLKGKPNLVTVCSV